MVVKNINELVDFSKKDQIQLEQAYIDSLQNESFKEYVRDLNIEQKVLMKYTSMLEDASKEFYHCKDCKGLSMCQNEVLGYLLTPSLNENKKTILFSYHACPYMQKELKEKAHQKYMTVYDVPTEIKSASFQDLYKDDKKRLPIIKYFHDYIDSYKKDHVLKGMYLYGSFGSGKTYLIAALFNELAKREIPSVIVYFPEFLRGLKSSFGTDFEERFQYIKNVPLLLLDDIGAENITAWGRDEILGPLLQYRMDSSLSTFFTSNLSIEELEKHFSTTANGVDKIKARRIIERIKQMSEEFSLVSVNRRK